jgi:uncharacterized protein
MKIFIDTSVLIALYSLRDQNYKQAQVIVSALVNSNAEFFTTDYVLDEVYTGLITNPKAGYRAALRFDRKVKRRIWKVITVDERLLEKARGVFMKFNKDKTWSFTDCTSYVVMK